MADEEHTELISRLRVIEGQPLGERAEAYTALHDELARELEPKSANTSPMPRGA
ncbi:hypothetical protein [Microbacterium terrisoli]|jgi:hypothetical protein|uniref:hypothetical protein n=1 Tax=Microbacterium terrisoli TaxID=3242192 RepID=UPI002805BB1C|nr:hypothetical protein [Microbacterium protaetiae]